MKILIDAGTVCVHAVFLLVLGVGQPLVSQEGSHYTKSYANTEYGFSVRIPPPLVGLGEQVPDANRGFRIHFSDDEFDRLSVMASIMTETSASSGADSDRHPLTGFEALDTQNRKTELGGLEATRIFQRLRRQTDGALFMMVTIVAKRQDRSIEYTLTLQAPQKHYVERAKVLDAVVDSFRLLSLK